MRRSVRAAVGAAAALAVLGPLGYLWQDSLVPSTYDPAAMGSADFGGGERHAHGGGLNVASLAGPRTGTPDVVVTLTARHANGRYTVNGASPGPEIRALSGQLIQVTLVNDNVPDGVTLHWHGVHVPNAEDGVAGVTQDAVRRGESHVYRFVARDAGTYWYHSHQVSHEQVRGGLFGALVVLPGGAGGADSVLPGGAGGVDRGLPDPAVGVDRVVAVHTYDGRRTINGAGGVSPLEARAGQVVRARIINTDAGPIRVWVSGAPYRVVAVDGRDVHAPPEVSGKAVVVAAGGRADLRFTVPASGAARVDVGAGVALVAGQPAGTGEPRPAVDLLAYGTPAAIGFDPRAANRVFDYRIGRRIGFLDGMPGMWWTINGRLFPDVPMFMVRTGDVVRMKVANASGEVHPMHLHGHHAVVLSRNGVAATGSPWWVDSLDVGDGETYEIAFLADNPGIWADHCHNLEHAAEGLQAHVMYEGVETPYRVGGKSGNRPE